MGVFFEPFIHLVARRVDAVRVDVGGQPQLMFAGPWDSHPLLGFVFCFLRGIPFLFVIGDFFVHEALLLFGRSVSRRDDGVDTVRPGVVEHLLERRVDTGIHRLTV